MILKEAQDLAVAICYELQPFCDRINIAGSIRRRKPEVKDIEIVCQPKVTETKDLFDTVTGSQRNSEFIAKAKALGRVIKGEATGRYMKIDLGTIVLDLFIPELHDYYRQYAIRTGSADYSFKVIAAGWKKLGWCGSDKGLRKMADCVESKDESSGKSKWKCVRSHAEEPPAWQSEEEFFSWLQVPLLLPQNRIINS